MKYIFIILTLFIFLLFYNYNNLIEGNGGMADMSSMIGGSKWNECNPDDLGDLSNDIGDYVCDVMRLDLNNTIDVLSSTHSANMPLAEI